MKQDLDQCRIRPQRYADEESKGRDSEYICLLHRAGPREGLRGVPQDRLHVQGPNGEGDHILVFCEMLFSTKKMCADGGHEVIKEACDKFGTRK